MYIILLNLIMWPAFDSDKPVSVLASTERLRFHNIHRRFAQSRMCGYVVATDVDVNPEE